MYSEEKVTEIWQKYQKGKDHHDKLQMYTDIERYHKFYAGDQWCDLKIRTEKKRTLPVNNFIKPVGKYKISMIAQNNMAIVYTSMGENSGICDILNVLAEQTWEKAKMDFIAWETIKNAFIAGDHYAYWHDDRDQYKGSIKANTVPSLKCRLINAPNIYFSNEQNPNIQEQEYIIVSERLPVSTVKKIAKENGISKEEINLIGNDEDTDTQIGEDASNEVETKDGKCTSLLYMTKKNGVVCYSRSVKSVIYQKEIVMDGLDTYPIAGLRWETFIGTARGISGVKQMLPNQISVNQISAWIKECLQKTAFPKLVAVMDGISNPEALNVVGATIKVQHGAVNDVRNSIGYINPAPISNDAHNFYTEMMQTTRELEGAGEAATGAVDPTKASGEAIKAARDQAAVSLNEQMAAYRQYIEDTAVIWHKLWKVGAANGLTVSMDGQKVDIPYDAFSNVDIDAKIDVTPVDPYSRTAREVLLKGLFESGVITLEEYTESLSDSSPMPKDKLQDIIENRKSQINPQLMQMLEQEPQIGDMLLNYIQGAQNEMLQR